MQTTATTPAAIRMETYNAQQNHHANAAAFNAILQANPINPLQILQGDPAAQTSTPPAVKPLTRRPRPGQLFHSQTLYWQRFNAARPRNADGTYAAPFPFWGHDFIGIHAHTDRDGSTYYTYTAPTILREIAGPCYEPAFMAITFPTLGDALAGARSICRARHIPGSDAQEHNIFIVIVK